MLIYKNKTILCSILSATLLLGVSASASWSCHSVGSELEVEPLSSPAATGADTHMVLKQEGTVTEYEGHQSVASGTLLQEIEIQLEPLAAMNSLSIYSRPVHCGRGSCDVGLGAKYSATLKLGDKTEFFDCKEILPE